MAVIEGLLESYFISQKFENIGHCHAGLVVHDIWILELTIETLLQVVQQIM
jgi:hypothetical protein